MQTKARSSIESQADAGGSTSLSPLRHQRPKEGGGGGRDRSAAVWAVVRPARRRHERRAQARGGGKLQAGTKVERRRCVRPGRHWAPTYPPEKPARVLHGQQLLGGGHAVPTPQQLLREVVWVRAPAAAASGSGRGGGAAQGSGVSRRAPVQQARRREEGGCGVQGPPGQVTPPSRRRLTCCSTLVRASTAASHLGRGREGVVGGQASQRAAVWPARRRVKVGGWDASAGCIRPCPCANEGGEGEKASHTVLKTHSADRALASRCIFWMRA